MKQRGKNNEWSPILLSLSLLGLLYNMSYVLPFQPYKLHKIDKGPATETSLTREEALKYYKDMFFIRKIQETAIQMFEDKLLTGPCHLYTGQVNYLIQFCYIKHTFHSFFSLAGVIQIEILHFPDFHTTNH